MNLKEKLKKFEITIVEITLLQKEEPFKIDPYFTAETINDEYNSYKEQSYGEKIGVRIMNDIKDGRLYNINMAGEPMLDKPVKEKELQKYLENIDGLINKALIKYYNRYQLNWLIDHNYGLEDFLNALHPSNDIEEAYENIYKEGINGEIFLPYNEWCDQIIHIDRNIISAEKLITKGQKGQLIIWQ